MLLSHLCAFAWANTVPTAVISNAIEKSDDRIAQTVIENTKTKDQKILELNSMQSITSDEIADGVTYLSVIEDNLDVLKEALN